jgi:hypothetical protein
MQSMKSMPISAKEIIDYLLRCAGGNHNVGSGSDCMLGVDADVDRWE